MRTGGPLGPRLACGRPCRILFYGFKTDNGDDIGYWAKPVAPPVDALRCAQFRGIAAQASSPGIFGGVGQALGLVPGDVGDAEELEDLEHQLAVMAEGHGAMVRIVLLDQDMAVEAAHVVDGEHTDAAEGAGRDRQDFALGDVAAQDAFAVALQAVEGDVGSGDVAFQRAAVPV